MIRKADTAGSDFQIENDAVDQSKMQAVAYARRCAKDVLRHHPDVAEQLVVRWEAGATFEQLAIVIDNTIRRSHTLGVLATAASIICHARLPHQRGVEITEQHRVDGRKKGGRNCAKSPLHHAGSPADMRKARAAKGEREWSTEQIALLWQIIHNEDDPTLFAMRAGERIEIAGRLGMKWKAVAAKLNTQTTDVQSGPFTGQQCQTLIKKTRKRLRRHWGTHGWEFHDGTWVEMNGQSEPSELASTDDPEKILS